jgi:hypothetical protein
MAGLVVGRGCLEKDMGSPSRLNTCHDEVLQARNLPSNQLEKATIFNLNNRASFLKDHRGPTHGHDHRFVPKQLIL